MPTTLIVCFEADVFRGDGIKAFGSEMTRPTRSNGTARVALTQSNALLTFVSKSDPSNLARQRGCIATDRDGPRAALTGVP
jgi:hypothetical protein